MKKNIYYILIFCVCFGLCACLTAESEKKTNTDSGTSSINTVSVDVETDPIDNTTDWIDSSGLFYAETEMQMSFYLLVKNNPIDFDYLMEESVSTTLEMRRVEQLYTSIWLDELEFSCEKFSKLLNNEDRMKFESIQVDWEKNLLENFQFINRVFRSEEYNVALGSIFPLECDIEYRERIRQRTLYIKYLQYYMESSNETFSDAVVEFKYQSKDSAGEEWAYQSNCKLIVNGKDISDGYFVRINHQSKNAELPIILILMELGADIRLQNETTVLIEFEGKIWSLELADKDFGLPIPSGTTNPVRRVIGGQIIVDSDSISELFVNIMGAKIRLNFDSSIIYVDTIK